MPLVPPFEALQLSRDTKQLLTAALAGNLPDQEKLLHSLHKCPPLGQLRLAEILALYGSPQRLEETQIQQAVLRTRTFLDKALGKNWKGINIPTSVLTFLNPNLESTLTTFAQPQGNFFANLHNGRSVCAIRGVLSALYNGNSSRPSPFEAENLTRQIEVMTALAAKPTPTGTCLSLLDFLLPTQGNLSMVPKGLRSGITWITDALHDDPRLVPLYPQIRDAFLNALNSVDGRKTEGVTVRQIESWLQTLAEQYLRGKLGARGKQP